ncbi:hypothetical protein HHI36_009998 [Cryptolaemus montrouzieri]|uniref:Uncharacterized protein n=1 Tax=Cryptolaemus montrouzieri TaxID=559131 RepID=A0ABD2MHI7_9CUCU
MLVEATKAVSKYDSIKRTFASPTYAMNICNSLKQCCDIAIHMIIKSEPSVKNASCQADLKSMIHLLESNWRFDLSNQASSDLNMKKFNKITVVPLANDLKIFKDFLMKQANQAIKILNRNPTAACYRNLMETIYCRKEDNPDFQSSKVGYKVVSKYAASCGAKNPKALTCTKLRKHLATLTQLFNMNDNEIDQLARFMGHTVGVHKNSYRLPDDEDGVSEHSEDENDTAALVSERTLIDEVDRPEERKQKKAKQIVNKKRRVLIP